MNSPAEFFAWVEQRLSEGNASVETACRAGCSWCCRGNVPPVSAAEQELLAQGLAQLEPATLDTVLANARAIVDLGLDEGPAMTAGNRPCPLLNEDDDRCRVYAHRPLACRLFGATTIEPGWHFGCDAIQLGLSLSGQSLVPIDAILSPFEQRPDVGERITLARYLTQLPPLRDARK